MRQIIVNFVFRQESAPFRIPIPSKAKTFRDTHDASACMERTYMILEKDDLCERNRPMSKCQTHIDRPLKVLLTRIYLMCVATQVPEGRVQVFGVLAVNVKTNLIRTSFD